MMCVFPTTLLQRRTLIQVQGALIPPGNQILRLEAAEEPKYMLIVEKEVGASSPLGGL